MAHGIDIGVGETGNEQQPLVSKQAQRKGSDVVGVMTIGLVVIALIGAGALIADYYAGNPDNPQCSFGNNAFNIAANVNEPVSLVGDLSGCIFSGSESGKVTLDGISDSANITLKVLKDFFMNITSADMGKIWEFSADQLSSSSDIMVNFTSPGEAKFIVSAPEVTLEPVGDGQPVPGFIYLDQEINIAAGLATPFKNVVAASASAVQSAASAFAGYLFGR